MKIGRLRIGTNLSGLMKATLLLAETYLLIIIDCITPINSVFLLNKTLSLNFYFYKMFVTPGVEEMGKHMNAQCIDETVKFGG